MGIFKKTIENIMGIYYILVLLFIATIQNTYSQNFTIDIYPKGNTINVGETAEFDLTVNPISGYNSTVFLSIASSDIDQNSISISPSTPNPPYSNIKILVKSGVQDTGIKLITIRGTNNGIVSSVTIKLTINKNIQWSMVSTPDYFLGTPLQKDKNGYICYGMIYNNYDTIQKILIYHFIDKKWISDTINYFPENHNSHLFNLSFAFDSSNTIWLSAIMDSDKSTILHFDGKFINSYNAKNSNLNSDYLNSLIIDKKGKPICAIGDYSSRLMAISKFDGNSWNNLKIKPISTMQASIYPNTNFIIDNLNQIWLPTLGAGAIKMVDSVQYNINSTNSGLFTNEISKIYFDKFGSLWFLPSSNDNKISKFDGKNWTYISSPISKKFSTIPNIIIDNNNNIWTCSFNGLHLYQNNSWFTYNSTNSPLPSNNITNVISDNDNNIWMVCNNQIYVFNPSGLVNIPKILEVESANVIVDDKLIIYPNPASKEITIKNPTKSFDLFTISDLLGRVFYSVYMKNENETKVDISNLNQGIYICKLGNFYSNLIIDK